MKNEVVKQETQLLDNAGESKDPAFYQVLLVNDDFTPMEFVIDVLEKFFGMDRRRATEVMFKAHLHGHAGCGTYTKDVAETKISLIHDEAKKEAFPLTCNMEVAI